MHPSAMENGKLFFDTYLKPLGQVTVADIGAQNVNGSLKDVCPDNATYIGVDFVQGKGVDIIIDDPYKLPFEDGSLDAVVSSSCFEHSEFFWLLFNEIMRVLKPTGLFYLNAPSNGLFHRYPVDCWRFYPDSGNALANWANRCGYNTLMLESYTSYQSNGLWNDYVAVFLKDREHLPQHPDHQGNASHGKQRLARQPGAAVAGGNDRKGLHGLSSPSRIDPSGGPAALPASLPHRVQRAPQPRSRAAKATTSSRAPGPPRRRMPVSIILWRSSGVVNTARTAPARASGSRGTSTSAS